MLCTTKGYAADGDDEWADDFEDDDAGFAPISAPPSPAMTTSGPFRIKLGSRLRTGAFVERTGVEQISTVKWSNDLSTSYTGEQIRAVIGVRLDVDPVYLTHTRGFDEPTREAYAYREFGQETLIAYRADALDVSVGRQSIAWGQGDLSSPLDVVTPLDQRETGLADIDELRRPRLLSRLSWTHENHQLELIVAHEAYYGERPTPRAEYSPLRAALSADPVLNSLLGDKKLLLTSKQSGFAPSVWDQYIRWTRTDSGVDLSLTAARLRFTQGVFTLPEIASLANTEIDFQLDHPIYYVLGHSGAMTKGGLLIKWDLALNIDEPVNTGQLTQGTPMIETDTVNRFVPLLQVGYALTPSQQISAEGMRPIPFTEVNNALYPLDLPIFSVRWTQQLLRERLTLVAVATGFGFAAEYGGLARVEAAYELRDGLRSSVAFVHYHPGRAENFGPLYGLDRHDQILFQLKWSGQTRFGKP